MSGLSGANSNGLVDRYPPPNYVVMNLTLTYENYNKENPVCFAVSEILRYKHSCTETQTSCYFIIRIYSTKKLEHVITDGAATNGKVPATNAEAMNNINDKKQEQK